jgi:hypothetical protein
VPTDRHQHCKRKEWYSKLSTRRTSGRIGKMTNAVEEWKEIRKLDSGFPGV